MSFVGIDISKARLDVAVLPTGEVRAFDPNPGGLEQLCVWLQTQDLELAVLEATGGLEHDVLVNLSEASLPINMVNPRQVRDCLGPTTALSWTKRHCLEQNGTPWGLLAYRGCPRLGQSATYRSCPPHGPPHGPLRSSEWTVGQNRRTRRFDLSAFRCLGQSGTVLAQLQHLTGWAA